MRCAAELYRADVPNRPTYIHTDLNTYIHRYTFLRTCAAWEISAPKASTFDFQGGVALGCLEDKLES